MSLYKLPVESFEKKMLVIMRVVCWAVVILISALLVHSFSCLISLQSRSIEQYVQTQLVDQLQNQFASQSKYMTLLPNYFKNIVN